MRNTIENAAGIYLQSDTEVRNYQLKKDRILTYAEGYILKYELRDKYIDTNNDIVVELEAVVSDKRLYNDLASLQILQMVAARCIIRMTY